jgi:hypothetical protein
MSDDNVACGPECARYAEEIAELALGISTGRRRAQALAHIETCPRCHAEVEQLSLAADSLLEVVPGVEPPLGFEVRLMDRFQAGLLPRRGGRRQWFVLRPSLALAGLALLVALGVGVGAGWVVRGGAQPAVGGSSFGTAPGGRAETASLKAAGRLVGDVTVYSGRTTWLFMSLADGSWSGEASCEVGLADGKSVLLGTFWLDNGYGAWGVTLASGTGRVRSASVLTAGKVLASAEFSSDATAYLSGTSAHVRSGGREAPAPPHGCQPFSSSSTVSGSSRRTPASIASTTSRGSWSFSCSSS